MSFTEKSKEELIQELVGLKKENNSLKSIISKAKSDNQLLEVALKKCREQYFALLRALPDIIFIHGKDGVFDDYHSPGNSILYAPPEAFLGKKMAEVLPAELAGKLEQLLLKAVQTRKVQSHEYSILINDEVRYFEARITAFEDEKTLSIIRDITQSKLASQAIQVSEERFRTLFQNIPGVSIQGYDTDGTTLFWNKASEDIYGYSEQEAIGRNILDLIIPTEMKRKVQEAIKDMAETGIAVPSSELELVRKDGYKVPVFSSQHIINLPGQNQELFCVDIDLTSNKKAEEELRLSEERLRIFFSMASEGMMIHRNGIILDANQAFLDIIGVKSLSEVSGKKGIEVIPFTPESKLLIIKSMAEDSETPFDISLIKPDGSIVYLETQGKKFFHKGDECRLVYMRDITARNHAEKMFHDIIDKNPISIQILDLDGYTIQTNSAHFDLFGAIAPKDYSIFKDPQLLQQGLGELFDQIKNGEVVYFPDSLFNPHDVNPDCPDIYNWIKAIGFSLNDSTGKSEKIVIMHENITERKLSEKMLQDIIENNPMSIQIVDKEGLTLQGNPSYIKLFGSMPPPNFSIFDDLQSKGSELEKYITSVKKGDVVRLPDMYYNPHDVSPEFPDNPVWIRALIFPLKDSNGQPERFVFMHENITERKKAEDEILLLNSELESRVEERTVELQNTFEKLQETNIELQILNDQVMNDSNKILTLNEELMQSQDKLTEALKTKDRFFTIIAHDLKNPFVSLINNSELLERYYDKMTDPEKLKIISKLKNASKNTHSLLDNLLVWARSQTGSIKFAPYQFDLNDLMLKIKLFIQFQADSKNITVNFNLDGNFILEADEDMLNTILRNLATNAIKFTTRNGVVEIGAYRHHVGISHLTTNSRNSEEQETVIYVKDSGIGIDEDSVKKLFHLDQKVFRPGTEGELSTGLGLILCKEFVEKHRGKIWAESEVGKGSTFHFSLPERMTV